MLSRRSLFSLFAGAGAVAAGAKVVEDSPHIGVDLAAGPDRFAFSRGSESYLSWVTREYGDDAMLRYEAISRHYAEAKGVTIPPDDRAIGVRPLSQVMTISEDPDRKPVNMRSDGSIRHRQHHPVDFPPKR